MKCEKCGTEMGRDEIVDSHQPLPSGRLGGGKIVRFAMCRTCADSRRATQKFLFWAMLVMVALLLAAAFVSI